MKVSDAVNSRKSIRAFLDLPIETGLLKNLLEINLNIFLRTILLTFSLVIDDIIFAISLFGTLY